MTRERPAYRPKRPLRNEIYALVLVMLAPLGVALVFPYASLSFKSQADGAAAHAPRRSLCSLIALTDEQADAAVKAARSAIKTAHEGISALRADLSLSAVPEECVGVAVVGERLGVAPMGDAPYDVTPLPRSLAAPPPDRLAPCSAAANTPSVFSREEMLEIGD